MKPDGRPDPELLAAYLDGEFEGRDGMDDLRRRVESWLESNPDAQESVRDHRRLRQAWSDTTPVEPSATTWAGVLARVRRGSKATPRRSRHALVLAAALALAACIILALLAIPTPRGASPDDNEPFPVAGADEVAILGIDPADLDTVALRRPLEYEPLPVASAAEVAILQVEGRDTITLVVGTLPVHGPLELVTPEEVAITRIEPAEDNMVPQVRIGARSPTIWARAKAE